MSDGFAEMKRQVERLRALGPALVREAAPKVAKAIHREVSAQLDRGVGPDGKPWAPRKDGGRALANASAALSVRAVPDGIVLRIDGPEALHHRGGAKGGVKRPMLPSNEIPDAITDAIVEVLGDEFGTRMGGGR